MFKKLNKDEYSMPEAVTNLLAREKLPEFEIKIPERIPKLQSILSTAKQSLKSSYDYNGIATTGRQGIHIHVSKDNIDRAIKILSVLMTAFEKREFQFDVQNQHGNFVYLPTVKIQGVNVRFRVQERTKKTIIKNLNEIKSSYLRKQLDYNFKAGESYLVPTGNLYLQIEDDYSDLRSRKLWEDSDKSKIEDHLNSFMEGLIMMSEGLRLKEIRWEEDRKQRDAKAAVYEHQQRQRQAKENRMLTVKSLADKMADHDRILTLQKNLQNNENYTEFDAERVQFLKWIDLTFPL